MNLIDILRKLGILRFGSVGGTYKNYVERPDELMYNNVYDKKKDLMSSEDYKKVGEAVSKATGVKVPAGLGAKIFFWMVVTFGVLFLLLSLLIMGFSLWFWLSLLLWVLVFFILKKYLARELPFLFTLGMVLFIFVVTFVFLAIGMPTQPTKPSAAPAPTPPPAVQQTAPAEKKSGLDENVFVATTMHMKVKRLLTLAGGKKQPLKEIEMWIKGDRLREDVFDKGKRVYTYISNDGKTVISYNYKTMKKEVSPAPAIYYLLGYRKPPAEAKYIGVDKESGVDLYDYQVDRTFAEPGSTYSYYVKNIVYGVKNQNLFYFTIYGASPVKGQKPAKLNSDIFMIAGGQLNQPIEDAVFNAPF